ncbi:tripartite tricarboxylate transporter permease [Dethiosulfatarculus sandiegensis]|uniref:C4-dicarboxylate ABC transporter permease n=1 Tax=Dethiosulfatarculus sandiegensis TaxID=1429043 RepID=A0A0D2J9Q1_9BACT|nr:tripartite tricarboxylate transporter permease [Dethiosulfatarculus sandiegensis]KIX14874.1 C4-dicarboxylate ABC transporter permease [Dethiosulfatarculus sandiegensis]
MGVFELLTAGLGSFSEPFTLFLVVAGSVLGIFFGAIPGLTATMGMAIFMPMTFAMSDVHGMVFLVGIYVGACYSGSLSSILVNIPGTPSAIATGFDGHTMAKKGKAGQAIGYATLASALGGLFGVLILVFAAPVLASLALEFSAQEYTGIALLGISIVSYISFGSTIKGLIGGLIGLLLATVGQDVISAYPRFVFGSKDLQAGLQMIPVMVGFFGVTEVLVKLESETRVQQVTAKISKVLPKFSELFRFGPKMAFSSIIGTFIGAIPAAGGAIASMAAYGLQKRFSKDSEKYGTGIPEGVVAAEAANNAAVGGAFVPMLSLGIPGDPQTAILIGALMINGLAPGPLLFATRPDIISTIYLGNVFSVVTFALVGLFGARYFARLIKVPSHFLLPAILLACIVGAYAIRNTMFDVWVLLGCGLLGYLLQKISIMPAPIILGFVLGPILEDNFRRSLIMSNGDWSTFVTRPISLFLILVNLAILLGPSLWSRFRCKPD